jgi:hypothetical protein
MLPLYFGVSLRAYVVDANATETETKISSRALAAAKRLPRATVRNASLTTTRDKQWDRMLVSYDVWYGDYGGRANVDFYVRQMERNTIVLVFMYAGVNDTC